VGDSFEHNYNCNVFLFIAISWETEMEWVTFFVLWDKKVYGYDWIHCVDVLIVLVFVNVCVSLSLPMSNLGDWIVFHKYIHVWCCHVHILIRISYVVSLNLINISWLLFILIILSLPDLDTHSLLSLYMIINRF